MSRVGEPKKHFRGLAEDLEVPSEARTEYQTPVFRDETFRDLEEEIVTEHTQQMAPLNQEGEDTLEFASPDDVEELEQTDEQIKKQARELEKVLMDQFFSDAWRTHVNIKFAPLHPNAWEPGSEFHAKAVEYQELAAEAKKRGISL